ncbi:G-box-binding factor-like isoform X2 [Armigeres subalbatus]|uniref:G-box-binding factor-like isoform X2 n=1 Tax=Armigeres subalbatus TaxID=124917 RepID=UPI002ED0DC37
MTAELSLPVPAQPPSVSSMFYPPFDVLNVTSSFVSIASPSQTPTLVTTSTVGPSVSTEDFVVLPGPEDVLLFNSSNGLYQQSVTLTARMYPIEATAAKSIWGLPTLIWGILIGTIVILIVILATLFFCCWLQPRSRKLLSSSYYTGSNVSHNSVVPKSHTSDSNQLVMPLSIGICPPQYSAPPPPTSNNSGSNSSNLHQQNCAAVTSTGIPCHPAGGSVGNSAGHHGKYGSSPQQYSHAYHPQQQPQFQHHHQCIHHQQQQQQQQQQQYHSHYAQLQHQQHQQSGQYPHQQQTLQQYYNQQQQQHQQQQQQQHQQITQYIHPSQQQALQQQQQREHQTQQHHYHHQPHHHQQQQQHQQGQLVHHKSMWAINPLYASSGGINDASGDGTDEDCGSTSYRTRSLPSWGKNKQRPLSNADDLDELYAKVNFSKKRRNRMRNDEAAIIALCRSRSQNLSALPLSDQDAVVVYDERTAL